MTLTLLGNGNTFGRRHGSDRPSVLALHGWGRDHRDFDASLKGLNALAVDLPGFGATPEPPTAWGGAGYATAIAHVVEEMHQPVVVVGHSFGGRVAVHLAQQTPDLIAGLVLTGVPLVRESSRPTKSPMRFRLARQLNRLGLLGETRMDQLRNKYGSADYRAASGIMRDILVTAVNETYEDQLRDITCPVELLWGSNDTAAPVEVARAAESLLANPTLTVADGVDHFLPISRPDLVRAAIDRTLLGRKP